MTQKILDNLDLGTTFSIANLGAKSVFVSAEQTGSGVEQNIAHGLGATPAKVFVAITGSVNLLAAATITEGTHDGTNVKVTCTTNWRYRVIAFL